MALEGKTALVTGANGFVGSAVTRRLREEGVRVRALVRRQEAAREVEALGAEPFLGELTDPQVLRRAIQGTQLVVHCAASLSDDLQEALRINAEATGALLEVARSERCERFVHVSTMAVYELDGGGTVDEQTPLVTRGSAYALSKAEGDRRVLAAMATGLPAVILRPPVILGLHPTSTWGTRVPRAIAAGQFAVAGAGDQPLFFVHVQSLAEAVLCALQREAAVGQVLNVVDGQRTWRQYAEPFARGALRSIPEAQAPAHLRFRGRLSGDKAVRVLGHAPRGGFEEAQREALTALQRP